MIGPLGFLGRLERILRTAARLVEGIPRADLISGLSYRWSTCLERSFALIKAAYLFMKKISLKCTCHVIPNIGICDK